MNEKIKAALEKLQNAGHLEAFTRLRMEIGNELQKEVSAADLTVFVILSIGMMFGTSYVLITAEAADEQSRNFLAAAAAAAGVGHANTQRPLTVPPNAPQN